MEQSMDQRKQQATHALNALRSEYQRAMLLQHNGLLWVTCDLMRTISQKYQIPAVATITPIGTDIDQMFAAFDYLQSSSSWSLISKVLQSA